MRMHTSVPSTNKAKLIALQTNRCIARDAAAQLILKKLWTAYRQAEKFITIKLNLPAKASVPEDLFFNFFLLTLEVFIIYHPNQSFKVEQLRDTTK